MRIGLCTGYPNLCGKCKHAAPVNTLVLGISAVPHLGQQQRSEGCRGVALGAPPSHVEGQHIQAQGSMGLVQLAPSAVHCNSLAVTCCHLTALIICSSFPPALGGGVFGVSQDF